MDGRDGEPSVSLDIKTKTKDCVYVPRAIVADVLRISRPFVSKRGCEHTTEPNHRRCICRV